MKKISQYDQYKSDFFRKLNYKFIKNYKILDVGCGDGGDAIIFQEKYKLDTYANDIFKHENFKKLEIKFKRAGIYKIPYASNTFDYIFLHDVLHHIDEPQQRFKRHIDALKELKRVCKPTGSIIIVEANRYNPLFYPHMVLVNKHDHFTQKYFKKLINSIFQNVTFRHFECHVYPGSMSFIWNIYEVIMEKIMPKNILAYNVAIIPNKK